MIFVSLNLFFFFHFNIFCCCKICDLTVILLPNKLNWIDQCLIECFFVGRHIHDTVNMFWSKLEKLIFLCFTDKQIDKQTKYFFKLTNILIISTGISSVNFSSINSVISELKNGFLCFCGQTNKQTTYIFFSWPIPS